MKAQITAGKRKVPLAKKKLNLKKSEFLDWERYDDTGILWMLSEDEIAIRVENGWNTGFKKGTDGKWKEVFNFRGPKSSDPKIEVNWI